MKKLFLKLCPLIFLNLIILIWQILCSLNLIPEFMLPSPYKVYKAIISDFSVLLINSTTTLIEAILGVTFATIFSFLISILMDKFKFIYKCVFPIIVFSQTIPTIAIAPLFILWFGYSILAKIILVAIVCFFPISISILEGLKSCDINSIILMKSMGASKFQIFTLVKFPKLLPNFFSGLKIAVSYSLVSAVVAEWLGGYGGLGVYMIKVKKSFDFDKMFAAIFFISIISLILVMFVDLLRKSIINWEFIKLEDKH